MPNTRSTTRPLAALGLLIIACSLCAISGCRTETRQKLLTTFFDGVPEAGSKTNAPEARYEADGQPIVPPPGVAPSAAMPVARARFVVHPPYNEHNCKACHESQYSVRMKGTQKLVCFACHDDFLAKAKYKHSPADDGSCTVCHNPHESNEPKLLLKAVPALCTDCHDDVMGNSKFRHSPVESGDCLVCHGAHHSQEEKLLLRQGQALCYECHDKDDMAKIQAHSNLGNTSCWSCHDPHGSNREKLLKNVLPGGDKL